MNFELPTILIYIILPSLIGMASYIIRGLINRISMLEDKMLHTMTEIQTRQLLSDKYDPLAEDIRDIKDMQRKQFDMLYELNQRIQAEKKSNE